jgi:hypothetical protein
LTKSEALLTLAFELEYIFSFLGQIMLAICFHALTNRQIAAQVQTVYSEQDLGSDEIADEIVDSSDEEDYSL